MSGTKTRPRGKLKTYPWDVVDHLKTEEDMVGYLNAVLEEDDPGLLMAALGDVARAKGMTQVSRETGLGRESLYKSLSLNGNPEFVTVQKVLGSLGLKLRVSA